jgi:hypothetical protein
MMEAKLKQMERTSAASVAASIQSSPPLNASRVYPSPLPARRSARFNPPSDALSSQSIFPRNPEPHRRTSGHTPQSVLAKSEEGKSRHSSSNLERKGLNKMGN